MIDIISNRVLIPITNLVSISNLTSTLVITDALSTMLRLLGEESEEASWLIRARFRMEPVEPCDEKW